MQSAVSITTKKKRWWWYFPYVYLLCFVMEMVGVGLWDKNGNKAIAKTRECLQVLQLNVNTGLSWGAGALMATSALTVILGLCMLALGAGRSLIAYQADRTGATRMGGRLIMWLWFDAAFIFVWWLLTLWTVILLLGGCLATAVSYAMVKALAIGQDAVDQVQVLIQATGGVVGPRPPPAMPPFPPMPPAARRPPGFRAAPSPPAPPAGLCESANNCLDLSAFAWALGEGVDPCYCHMDQVPLADVILEEAVAYMKKCVWGNVIMVLTGTWILMAAASEFGVTRRERQLLRRIAKARAAQGNGEAQRLLDGGGGSGGISGFKKKGKKGSTASLAAPPEVITCPETGEVLEVKGDVEAAANPASAGNTGSRRKGGMDGSSKGGEGGPSTPGRSFSAKVSRSFVKGLAKSTKVFDRIGSLMGPR